MRAQKKFYAIRREEERGVMKTDWLDARFSFSFGDYRAPAWDSFGVLQALNEDVIQPGAGFTMHPHRDLEIFIIPLSGAVEHRDSLGNHSIVLPGEVQKMAAGVGIRHSQINPSSEHVDHHLQIWIRPRTKGALPSADHRRFDKYDRVGKWQTLVSPDGRNDSLTIDQDAYIYAAQLLPSAALSYSCGPGRACYLHAIKGSVKILLDDAVPLDLATGDAIAIQGTTTLNATSMALVSEVLLFDLPMI